MQKHKNSQKRIYEKDATYFVTFNTKDRYPFFAPGNPLYKLFCDLFIEELLLAKELKKFELYAFTIMYDHVHLLIKPGDEFDVSKCMQSIKKEFSRDINYLINYAGKEGEIPESRLRGEQFSKNHKRNFKSPKLIKYLNNIDLLKPLPKFQWQRSFHEHVIRNEQNFATHYNYISGNHLKHSAHFDYPNDWEYVYPNENNLHTNFITIY